MNLTGAIFLEVSWFAIQRVRAYQATWPLAALTGHLFVLFPGRDLPELTSLMEPG